MHQLIYEWHITFSHGDSLETLTLNEKHPYFKTFQSLQDYVIESATLIDMTKFSMADDFSEELDSIVHHIDFPSKPLLRRLFRRTEAKLDGSGVRIIPCLELDNQGEIEFIFAYRDILVRTKDLKHYREDWPDAN